MKSFTKGMIELWLILPTFLSTLFVTACLQMLVRQKMVLQKHVWVAQTKSVYAMQAHPFDSQITQRGSRFILDPSWLRRLPLTFRAFLVRHRTQKKSLEQNWVLPESFSRFYNSAFLHHSPEPFQRQVRFYSSFADFGSSMKNDEVFKNTVWVDLMTRAGFYYPIQFLGYKELFLGTSP